MRLNQFNETTDHEIADASDNLSQSLDGLSSDLGQSAASLTKLSPRRHVPRKKPAHRSYHGRSAAERRSSPCAAIRA